MTKPTRLLRHSLALTALLAMGHAERAAAESLVVNTDADDTTAGDGLCTLREAYTNANDNSETTSGDCVGGSGADVITFAGDYTITLATSLPDIASAGGAMTITGNGAAHTILQAAASAGSATHRLFKIGTGGNGTFEKMTLRYGVEASGGGLNVAGGTLTLNYVVLRDNLTTGLRGGALSMNGGSVTFNYCTVAGNRTTVALGEGGGIFVGSGLLTVNHSTISGNYAIGAGGGIYSNAAGTVVLNYSTVAANTSDTDDNGGDGGGVSGQTANVTIASSLIVGNTQGTASPVDADCAGTFTSGGYNLAGAGTGCNLVGSGDDTVTASSVFPNLIGALANNGGETPTHALADTAIPAIDVIPLGTNGCGTTDTSDQRGAVRPLSGSCDIGAYESADVTAPIVATFSASALSAGLVSTVDAFTASDATGVVGYLITESATPPTAGDAGWSASVVTSYTVGVNGTYTLYPWVKDAAGNVSAAFDAPAHVCPSPDECHSSGSWDDLATACTNPELANDTVCSVGSCQLGVCIVSAPDAGMGTDAGSDAGTGTDAGPGGHSGSDAGMGSDASTDTDADLGDGSSAASAGCGCATAGERSTLPSLWLAALVAAVVARRRRSVGAR